jgi:hypothetical protein
MSVGVPSELHDKHPPSEDQTPTQQLRTAFREMITAEPRASGCAESSTTESRPREESLSLNGSFAEPSGTGAPRVVFGDFYLLSE